MSKKHSEQTLDSDSVLKYAMNPGTVYIPNISCCKLPVIQSFIILTI